MLRTHDKNIHEILEEKKKNRKTKKHTKRPLAATTASTVAGGILSVASGPVAPSITFTGSANLGYIAQPQPTFLQPQPAVLQPQPAFVHAPTHPPQPPVFQPVTQTSPQPASSVPSLGNTDETSSENPLPLPPQMPSGTLSVVTQGNFESQLSNNGNLITISPDVGLNGGSITIR
jgi:hypothetical protein